MNRLGILYTISDIRSLYKEKKLSPDLELSYANNPESLFRKYKFLVSWFANTDEGRELLHLGHVNKEICLLLPSGYHEVISYSNRKFTLKATIFTRSIYAKYLDQALYHFDLLAPHLKDFEESKQVFLYLLKIKSHLPLPDVFAKTLFNTSTFNPDANVETTSVDGTASREGVDEPLSTITGAVGTNASDSGSNTEYTPAIVSSGSTDNFQILRRSFFLFDTSSLPDGSAITNAILSVYGTASNTKANQLGEPDFHIASSNPLSNTAIVASDYATRGTTSFGNISFSSFGTDQYNDAVLNASGIAAISKTGISKFSGLLSWDISNSFSGIWAGAALSGFRATFADTAGSQEPKLTVDFTTTTSTSTTTTTSTSTSSSTTTTSTSTTTTITTTSTSTSTSSSSSTSTTTTSTSTTTTSTSTTTTSTTWPYSFEVVRPAHDNRPSFSVERKTGQL